MTAVEVSMSSQLVESIPGRRSFGSIICTAADIFVKVCAAVGAEALAVVAANNIYRESEKDFFTDFLCDVNFI